MIITARRSGACIRCGSAISVGDKINWQRGVYTVSHESCPDGALLATPAGGNAVAAEAPRQIRSRYSSRCPKCEGYINVDDEVFYLRGQKAWHVECPPSPTAEVRARNTERLDALARIRKGIYRVSLTGKEVRYGKDYLNLNLVPNEKYGSVRVAEWQGLSLGYIDRDGNFLYWPSVEAEDRNSLAAEAILACLDIVLGSADPVEFARAYAVESATCWRCGADLVDEFSRATLMGDTCFRAQYGVTQRQGLKSGVVKDARVLAEVAS